MSEVRSNLVIELDEKSQQLRFSLLKKQGMYSPETATFTVEIDLVDLKSKGADGAEKLIGECVLGFFDRLTNGRLNLPKHYVG